MVERWCWSMWERLRVLPWPIHCKNDVICDKRWSFMRCADDISCFFGRCEIFLWDTMRLDPCLKHGCFQIVGCKGMHERVNEFGRKRGFGGGGGGWCGICWEGARVVGGAWRLRLPSFGGHDIVWSGGSSGFFSCVACEWTLPLFLACNPYATSCFVMSIFLVCDFVTVFACFCFGVLLLRYAIACFFWLLCDIRVR
jgi:hypothetical protein